MKRNSTRLALRARNSNLLQNISRIYWDQRSRLGATKANPTPGAGIAGLALAALLAAAVPGKALADNECGTATPPNVNTCSSASYATGITYTGVDGLQLQLKNSSMVVGDPGLSVETSSGSTEGVNVDAFGFSSITTSTDNASGISVIANGPGYAAVQMSSGLGFTVGSITTTGDNAHGVYAEYTDTTTAANLSSATVSVVNSGDITTSGQEAYGLYALNAGLGQVGAQWSQSDPTTTLTTAGYWGLLSETTNTANTGGVSAQVAGGVINSIGSGSTFEGGVMAKNVGLGRTFVQLSSTAITTNSEYGFGAAASNNNPTNTEDVTVQTFGGSVTTSGEYGHGLYSFSGGSTARASVNSGTEIETTGDNAVGVYATTNSGGAAATVSNGTIVTTGAGSAGVEASTGGSSDSTAYAGLRGGTITTSGGLGAGNYSAYGLFATTDGTGETQVDNRDTIETSGERAHGIFSDRTFGGGSARAYAINTGSITTAGDGAYGVHAVQGSGIYSSGPNTGDAIIRMESSGSSVTTTGANAYGLYAYNFSTGNAQVDMTGGTVTVSGTDSIAVSGYGQGGGKTTLNLMGGRIVANGSAQAAIGFADRSSLGTSVATNAAVTIGSGMSVDASGTTSDYAVWNGDDRAATKIDVTSRGTVTGHAMMGGGSSRFTLAGGSYTGNIYGDYDEINGSPSDTTNQGADAFVWTGGSLNSGFYGQGGNDTATISVGTSGTNFSAALFDGGSGTDTITFLNTANDGVGGGNITNWERFVVNNADIAFVDDGLTLNGYAGSANGVGDFTIRNGGRAITNTASNDFALAGNLFLADANSTFLSRGTGTTSIAGDVTNAGLLSLQDGVTNGRIAIAGDYVSRGGGLALDTTLGGDGSPTDRLRVAGTSSGTTSLFVANAGGSGAQTRRGIMVVDLNGPSTGNFTLGNADYVIPTTNEKALIAGAYGYALRKSGDDWYLQSRSTGGSGGTTYYQPATAVYEVYAPSLLTTLQLPTWRQRVGSRWDQNSWEVPAWTPGVNNDSPLWVRVDGTHGHREATQSTVDVSSFDQNIGGIHAGLDAMLHEDAGGNRLMGMLTSHYTSASTDISGKTTGGGKINTDSYGVGATATWLQPNGVYVDAQSRFSWFDSDLASDILGQLASGKNDFGYAFSGEIGKELPQSADWTLIPQIQLTMASVDGDAFEGPNGETVSVEDGESLTLRSGIAADKAMYWMGNSGAESIHAYGIANLYYDFLSQTVVNVSGTPLTHDLGGWAGEIGLGLTRNFSDDKYSLYGEVNTATGLENFGDSYLVSGKVGAHIYW